MQEKFGDKLETRIHTLDSEEAKQYTFKSPTHVLFENEWVPLKVALDKTKMEAFLNERL
ncbi:hypothetical protein HNR65_003488 [Desulfosalsimonas propionicica]|uniref:Uncharacterized protein n=2 Tax=Desulfosalsimonas propionicica TaxID=332175 RepID=A0A7W0HMB6_9BACT|nr:hypothetical protein [Desulfosalsimonas propionicica]MBA2883127.1 hypothetical protein [Desulfosalsimonas propionicica]